MTDPIDWTPRTRPLGAPAAPVPQQQGAAQFTAQQGSFMPPPQRYGYYPVAPPPAYPPTPRPPAARKQGIPTWGIIVAVVAAVVGVGFFLVMLLPSSGGLGAPKPSVRVTGCSYDGIFTHIQDVVVNHDKVAHDYRVE